MSDDPRDANGYFYRDYPAARHAREQAVKNTDWPMRDDKGNPHARNINDRAPELQRDVWVRLVLADDGEVVLPGRAIRWTDLPAERAHAYVQVEDPRVPGRAVWVRFSDVRPRESGR